MVTDSQGMPIEVGMKVLSVRSAGKGLTGVVLRVQVRAVIVLFESRTFSTSKLPQNLRVVDPDLELAEGL